MSNKAKLARGEATSSPTFTFSQKDELEKAGQRLGEAQTALAVLGHEQNILNRINELEKERNSLQDNGASVRRTFLNEELEKLRDQLTIAQGKEKTEKTLAQQLKIRTTEEIDAELKKLNVLLSQTKVVADRLRILEQIKKVDEWKDKKSLTFRFIVQDNNKTLDKEEVDVIYDTVVKALAAIGAELR